MIEEALLVFGFLSAAYGSYLIISEMLFQKKLVQELKKESGFTPSVSIIAPAKSPEPHLAENIRGLLKQDYPKGKVQYIFVADSEKDAAYSVLKKFRGKNVSVIASGKQPKACSGKISALLAGVRHAKNGVLVFADTDGMPRKGWLRDLVGRLDYADVSSGIRFYLPGTGMLSYIRSAWNSKGISQIFSPRMFPWGVSMAIRKRDFYGLDVPRHWMRALSDDLILGKLIKKSGKKLAFSPKSVMFTRAPCSFHDFVEFSNRQAIILRKYAPRWHALALIGVGGICFFVILGIAAVLLSFHLPAGLLFSIIPLYFAREYIRFCIYKPAFGIKGSAAKYALAGFLAAWLFAYNCLQAAFRSRIVWRGRTYAVRGPYNIEVQ